MKVDYEMEKVLAEAVLQQAVEDYIDLFMGKKETGDCNMNELNNYFGSDLCLSLMPNPKHVLNVAKILKLQEIIDVYELFLDEKSTHKIKISTSKVERFIDERGRNRQTTVNRSYIVEPRLLEAFIDTIDWQCKELKREIEILKEKESEEELNV